MFLNFSWLVLAVQLWMIISWDRFSFLLLPCKCGFRWTDFLKITFNIPYFVISFLLSFMKNIFYSSVCILLKTPWFTVCTRKAWFQPKVFPLSSCALKELRTLNQKPRARRVRNGVMQVLVVPRKSCADTEVFGFLDNVEVELLWKALIRDI